MDYGLWTMDYGPLRKQRLRNWNTFHPPHIHQLISTMIVTQDHTFWCKRQVNIYERKFSCERHLVENIIFKNNHAAICFPGKAGFFDSNLFFACLGILPATKTVVPVK